MKTRNTELIGNELTNLEVNIFKLCNSLEPITTIYGLLNLPQGGIAAVKGLVEEFA